MDQQLAAPSLVHPALIHAPLENVQLGLAHRPLQAQQQPVIEFRRIVKSILVGQQRPKDGAQLQKLMPVFARSGQPAHLQSQDQPDMVQADFRQHPLESQSAFGALPALSLILINDDHLLTRPSQRDGPIHQSVLTLSRFPMIDDLLRS